MTKLSTFLLNNNLQTMQTSLSDRTLTVYSDVSHVNLCAVTPLRILRSVVATSGFW
jgi:hypothetical protein